MTENRLKIIRRDLGGISQAKLATNTGIPLYKIAYAETDGKKISREIAEILRDKFDYNIAWIMTGEGPKKKEDAPLTELTNNNKREDIIKEGGDSDMEYLEKYVKLLEKENARLEAELFRLTTGTYDRRKAGEA